LNEGIAQQSVWYPHSVLTGGYWDLFLVLPKLLDRPPRTMLVIGDAGGTIPRAYGRFYPGVQIDGVELDPKVSEAGRRYFGLDAIPRLRTITADGRVFLERTGGATTSSSSMHTGSRTSRSSSQRSSSSGCPHPSRARRRRRAERRRDAARPSAQ
jgi:hypothetical protein